MKSIPLSLRFGLAAWIVMFASSSKAEDPVPSSDRSKSVVARVEGKLKEELGRKGLKLGAPIFIRIFKESAVLEMWVQKKTTYQLFRTYNICKFSGKLGPKLKRGDKQAPEGCYPVAPEQMNPNSDYHLSFNTGYPNEFDRFHERTGSDLMVHGACKSVGCYAMGDEAIEEIWTLCSRALENGQKSFAVHAFPFPLTKKKLKEHQDNEWIAFWKELQPIYKAFEKKHVPPNVTVNEGKYQLSKVKK
jgi:murein L,D-transpeptidase YafK